MNKEIIKDEIKWLLEAINEQYESICSHGDKIPLIEFDILMENVRKFYQNMHILQRLNDPVHYAENKAKTTDVLDTGRIAPESQGVNRPQSPKPEQPEILKTPGITVKISEPDRVSTKQEVGHEVVNLPLQSSPVQFKPVGLASGRHETSTTSKKSAKSAEIDLFASEEPAFSIKLKDAREKTLGPKIPSERIENLKSAITITEKFMFINELFDGNLREYNETVETLNGFKTIDQAADFLDLIRKKNFWNTGSNAFKKLQELVERRF
jgi:hypothetical protein